MADPIALTDPVPTPDPNPAPAADPAVSDPPQKPTKPDGFPEALAPFWADDKGLDFGKLGEDYTALSTLKAEQAARAAQIPDNPDEYEIALPEGFKLPDGVTFELKADDPAIAIAREAAKELGLTKDGFKTLVGVKAKIDLAEKAQLVEASAAERTKLGTKATQRIEAVSQWTQSVLGNDLANALLPMMFTAKSIEAFEKLMTVAKAAGTSINANGRDPANPTPPNTSRPLIDRLADAMPTFPQQQRAS